MPRDLVRKTLCPVTDLRREEAGCAHVHELLDNWPDAQIKMHVIEHALHARQARSALLFDGEYLPLEISGERSDRAIAFARKHGCAWAIAVVPRCLASMNAPVAGTLTGNERRKFGQGTFQSLPDDAPQSWTNVFAGREVRAISARKSRISMGEAFAGFPMGALVPNRC